jgi:hypothetical protein
MAVYSAAAGRPEKEMPVWSRSAKTGAIGTTNALIRAQQDVFRCKDAT